MFPATLTVEGTAKLRPVVVAKLIEYWVENKAPLTGIEHFIRSFYKNDGVIYVSTEYPSVVSLTRMTQQCFKIELLSEKMAHICIVPRCETYDIKLVFQKDSLVAFEFSATFESKEKLIGEMFDFASVKDFMQRYNLIKEDIYRIHFE